MKIVAKQSLLDRYVKQADPFTDKSIGTTGLTHLRCILIDADEDNGLVTFTAENSFSAIEFTVSEGIDILKGGKTLVKAGDLKTALSVIQADQSVELTATDNTMNLTGGRANVDIGVVPISSGKVALPSVGKTPENVSVEVKSEDFIRGFQIGSSAYDKIKRYPIYSGVHLTNTPAGLRFLSSNQKVSAYLTVPVVKEGDIALLLDPSTTSSVIDYVRQGKTVEITPSAEDTPGAPAHYLVKGEAGDTLYHIRVATLQHPVTEYPAEKLLGRIAILAKGRDTLRMDKAEMLRLFYAADRMCALSPHETEGQAKNIKVEVTSEAFTVSISGQASFEDSSDIKSWSGKDLQFVFQWGLNGGLIDSYPGKDDIQIALLERDDKPLALALYTGEDWTPGDGGLPDDYLALLPIREGKFI